MRGVRYMYKLNEKIHFCRPRDNSQIRGGIWEYGQTLLDTVIPRDVLYHMLFSPSSSFQFIIYLLLPQRICDHCNSSRLPTCIQAIPVGMELHILTLLVPKFSTSTLVIRGVEACSCLGISGPLTIWVSKDNRKEAVTLDFWSPQFLIYSKKGG